MAIWLGFSLTLLSFSLVIGQYQPNWDSLDSRPLPKWYDQSKFGIFLHWGVYAVPSYGGGPANEASEWFWEYWQGTKEQWAVDFMKKNYPPGFTYDDFAPSFNAELFDPDAWVEIFQASGAKYVILTSKHHEGWTNWQSKTSWNWNSVENGPHMDLVGALADATRAKSSIHFGLYFSQFEWFNPLYLKDKAMGYTTQTYVEEVSQPQMYEIVNTYKPEVIWSDGDWEANYTYWNSTGFLAWLYNESPVKDTVVVNDRWGSGCACHHGGYYTCSDRYQPHTLQKHKWENAMTIDKYSWGFRRDAHSDSYLNTSQLINDLVVTVSCGGNMLLNAGPTHGGRIMPVFEERLRQMGSWLSVNGEAIYNTTYWEYQNDTVNSNVWYTYNSEKRVVYGILLQWPDTYSITIGAVKIDMFSEISLLGYSGNITWKSEGTTVAINLPLLPLGGSLQWAWTFRFIRVTAN